MELKLHTNYMNVDPELSALIPPLTPDEFATLEDNIKMHGCRDALVVWSEENVLLDGHNRFNICIRNGILFDTREISLPDRDAAKVWMIDNQKGRRNLTDGWKFELAQVKKAILAEKGKEKLSEAGKKHTGNQYSEMEGLSIVDKGSDCEPAHNTQAEIAADLGWSTGKVAMADKVWKEAPEEVKEQIKSGDMSFNQAYKTLKDTPHVSHNSGENEWYTPPAYIEAAREAMGSIDTDPASCELANEIVQATWFFDSEDDGLSHTWSGNVWMNPPYAQPLIRQFAEAVASKYAQGEITQAVVLVNNATETEWFRVMVEQASAICFPAGRIRFVDKTGSQSGAPLQGQAIIYMGDRVKQFKKAFSGFGWIVDVCHKR